MFRELHVRIHCVCESTVRQPRTLTAKNVMNGFLIGIQNASQTYLERPAYRRPQLEAICFSFSSFLAFIIVAEILITDYLKE